ncbi:MAG TPA: metal ABC transporter substrate-binding protein [Candidatus Hypogeohydataceae bacterium YC41]
MNSRFNVIFRLTIRFALLTTSLGLALSLPRQTEAKLFLVATSTDIASIARFVGGDKVDVESIIQGYQNPHYVDVKPSYMVKLHKADMFVKIGLDLELWAPILAEGARNSKILYGAPGFVDASVGAEILEIPQIRVTRELGDIHLYGNPHYWLDPDNGKVIAHNILEGLRRIDPENSAYYEENEAKFDKKVDALLPQLEAKMKPYAGTKVITYHNTWPNFLNRFGLVAAGYVEPKPGVPPSPAHVTSLIEKMMMEKVKIIIQEPFYETKISQFVANKTGAKLVILSPSVLGAEGVTDYFSLFDYLIDNIIRAFQEMGIKPQT